MQTSRDKLLTELEGVQRELTSLARQLSVGPCGHDDTFHIPAELVTRIDALLTKSIEALAPDETAGPGAVSDDLSPRQREILSWVALGKSNSVIADILAISPHTVDTHLRRAFERLHTTDRTVAAIRAIDAGMIAPAGLHAA